MMVDSERQDDYGPPHTRSGILRRFPMLIKYTAPPRLSLWRRLFDWMQRQIGMGG